MHPCLEADEAGAREPCSQHMAFAEPGSWGSVFREVVNLDLTSVFNVFFSSFRSVIK